MFETLSQREWHQSGLKSGGRGSR